MKLSGTSSVLVFLVQIENFNVNSKSRKLKDFIFKDILIFDIKFNYALINQFRISIFGTYSSFSLKFLNLFLN